MANPINAVSNFIKNKPVNSMFFKVTSLIPLVGLVIQAAKMLLLKSEFNEHLKNVRNPQEAFNTSTKARDVVYEMGGLKNRNIELTNFDDPLIFLIGAITFHIFPPVGLAIMAASFALYLSHTCIAIHAEDFLNDMSRIYGMRA